MKHEKVPCKYCPRKISKTQLKRHEQFAHSGKAQAPRKTRGKNKETVSLSAAIRVVVVSATGSTGVIVNPDGTTELIRVTRI